MKQHTGDGLGGVLGLVIWILISPVSGFVIPSEIGNMYRKDGKEVACERMDWPLALPVRDPDHPDLRLVRQGAGRANRYWEANASVGAPAAATE